MVNRIRKNQNKERKTNQKEKKIETAPLTSPTDGRGDLT